MPTPEGWGAVYQRKLKTAKQAVEVVRSGHHIFVGSGAAEPQLLVKHLVDRATMLADTEIFHILTLGIAPYTEPKFTENFRHHAFFIGENVRQAVNQGTADYTPVFLSEIPRLFRSGRVPIDVALIQVSSPDRHGFCTYGISVDVVKAAAESARLVIAEVNPCMPRTLGDSFIHIDDIDIIVENEVPLLTLEVPPPDAIAIEIGRHIASLVADGSTLQLGIGSIPNAVLAALADKNDLGIHTEMFSDGVIDLVESGVVTNKRKTINTGKIVTSFVMGSQRLYDFVNDNPLVAFYPNEYTNDPFIIAQHDRMVAINGAIEVDLTGQVCSDSIGDYFYSGIGGQVDFIRGAARSKGGRPIIALPSTAKDGRISRIVPHLKEGAGVVTSRGDVHYVITEYGVADLHGKSIRERALALINIAHPDFRQELLSFAKERRYVPIDQVIPPPGAAAYPREMETYFHLKDGRTLFCRPVRPTDEDMLRHLFYSLSPESVLHRFFIPLRRKPQSELRDLISVDYRDRMVIVAVDQANEQERIVALAEYERDPATNRAEAAFLVQDDWQGKGIGTFLLDYLIRIAKARGISGFTAEVMADNLPMLRVFHKVGYPLHSKLAGGVYLLSFTFDD